MGCVGVEEGVGLVLGSIVHSCQVRHHIFIDLFLTRLHDDVIEVTTL